MKNTTKTIILFGLMGGMVTVLNYLMWSRMHLENMTDMAYTMLIGYVIMLLSCIPIFFGLRKIRANSEGKISFGKLLLLGLGIAGVAGLIYGIAWAVYYNTHPGILDWFNKNITEQMTKEGKTATEIQKSVSQMKEMFKMYDNPITAVLVPMFMEFMPVGLIVSLISAAILRMKS